MRTEAARNVDIDVARRSRASMKKTRWRAALTPYLAVAPFFLIFGAFGIFPFAFTIYMSFFSWDVLGDQAYIGAGNWINLFEDPLFWTALKNTLIIFAMSTIPQFIFALVIAAILNDRSVRGTHWFRLTLLLPNLTSSIAVAIIFSVIFGRQYGVANYFLGLVGLGPVNWHASVIGTQFVISIMLVWAFTGYTTLILYSGMRGIPRELYEAVSIDGGGRVRSFFTITLPLLKPILVFALITASIGGMQVLAEPLVFAGPSGGPQSQGLTLQLYMYTTSFRYHNFGYGATIAVAVFLLAAVVAVVNLAALRRFRGV